VIGACPWHAKIRTRKVCFRGGTEEEEEEGREWDKEKSRFAGPGLAGTPGGKSCPPFTFLGSGIVDFGTQGRPILGPFKKRLCRSRLPSHLGELFN